MVNEGLVTIKCPNCNREIPDDELLIIKGVANVEGTASLRSFNDEGVIWEPHDSWDEEVKCPGCGKFFAPDLVKYREMREKKTEV